MSNALLHHALLRPAVLQILRATGYTGAKPGVVDALTDIAGRYISLLASKAVFFANANHADSIPDVTDLRLALSESGILTPSLTVTDEVWRELMRTPISEVPERNGIRRYEESKRDEEDTEDITDFIKWFDGPVHQEIKRIAGLVGDKSMTELDPSSELPDYLTVLKKKHSKTGEESRFQGTVLGIGSDSKLTKIQGGPENLDAWLKSVKAQRQKVEDTQSTDSPDTTMTM